MKKIVLIFGLGLMLIGTILSALEIRTDAEAIDFTLNEDTVRKYGHFNDISETTITGTILKPYGADRDSGEHPCVFVFHGMFMNRFLQIQTAMYFAKAGMYVVMLDHAGQGESKGLYRLGYELEAIGKTVLDYFVAEGFQEHGMNVDLDSLGCNGHSYGGITSTFLGINRPELIKAVAAIWAWSELPQTVTDIMVGLRTDFDDIYDTAVYKFITSFTGFGEALFHDREGDYSTNPIDIKKTLEDRNTLDRVAYSKEQPVPPNYLLISAFNEELITAGQLIKLMATASWNPEGSISFDTFEQEINQSIDSMEEWSNLEHSNSIYKGSFNDKTARQLYLPKETEPFGHLMEGFTVESYVKILEWFGEAFDWNVYSVVQELKETGIDTDNLSFMDGTLPASAGLKMFTWILAVLGFLIAFPAIISYLIRTMKFKGDEVEYQKFINEFDDNTEKRYEGLELKLIGVAMGIYLLAEFLSLIIPIGLGLTPKAIGIPFIITDALILIMIGRYLVVIPAIILLFYLLVNKINRPLNFRKLGISLEAKDLLIDIILGIVVSILFLIAFNVIGLITIAPRLVPRNSPSIGYLGVIFLLLYFLVFFFFDELSFRGIIQTKLHDFIYTKLKRRPGWLKKWLEFWIACFFQMIILLVGTFLGLILILGGIPPVLVSSFLLGGISASFIPAFMSTYIYQRTRRIVPCMISSALILTFILGFSLIGAITF